MTRTRTIALLTGGAVVALVALIIAGCGGGGSGAGANASKAAVNVSGATIGVARGGLGNILVDSHGRTLYLFKKDSGAKSACFGECAHDWPPLRAVGKPTTGSGAKASLVASTARSDGRPEVTYNGHPVYLFEGDRAPGDVTGQGLTAFGGAWYVLSPNGDQITGSSSGGGNGY